MANSPEYTKSRTDYGKWGPPPSSSGGNEKVYDPRSSSHNVETTSQGQQDPTSGGASGAASGPPYQPYESREYAPSNTYYHGNGGDYPPPSSYHGHDDRDRGDRDRDRSDRDRRPYYPPGPPSHRDDYDYYHHEPHHSHHSHSHYGPPSHSAPRDHYRGDYRNDRDYPPRSARYDDYYDRERERDRGDRDAPRRRYPSGPPSMPGPRHTSRAPIRGNEEERKKSTTLWVGNLPYDYKEEEVLDMFERFGAIPKVTVPIDRYTTKNKGFAFVQFENRRDAEDAHEHFYGQSIEGRRIRIDWDVGLGVKADVVSQSRGARSPVARRFSPPPVSGGRGYGSPPLGPGARAYSPPPRDYSPRKM